MLLRGFGSFAEANCTCETRGVEESQFPSPPWRFAGARHDKGATIFGRLCISQIENGTERRPVQKYSDIQKSVMAKLKVVPIYERDRAMKRLKDNTKACVRSFEYTYKWWRGNCENSPLPTIGSAFQCVKVDLPFYIDVCMCAYVLKWYSAHFFFG